MSPKKWTPTTIATITIAGFIAAALLFAYAPPTLQAVLYGISSGATAILLIVYLIQTKHQDAEPTKKKVDIRTLLLVDDSSANRRIIMETLKTLPLRVIEADSGHQAMDQYQNTCCDAVLLDIEMDDLSGIEVAKKIRQQEKIDKRTPLIAISAHSSNEKKVEALTAGFDEYLSKPVDNEQLLNTLRRWLPSLAEQASSGTPLTSVNDPIHELKRLALDPKDIYAKKIHKEENATLEFIKEASTDNSATIKKVVDVKQSLAFSRNNSQLAKDMLLMLIELVQEKRQAIETLYQNKEWETLASVVHKINGGSCYCGVPELQQHAQIIDKALDQKQINTVNMHFPEFLSAMDELLEWDNTHDIDIIFED